MEKRFFKRRKISKKDLIAVCEKMEVGIKFAPTEEV